MYIHKKTKVSLGKIPGQGIDCDTWLTPYPATSQWNSKTDFFKAQNHVSRKWLEYYQYSRKFEDYLENRKQMGLNLVKNQEKKLHLRTPNANQFLRRLGYMLGSAWANSERGGVCGANISVIHEGCLLVRVLGPERKIKARLVVTSEFGPKKH